MTQHARALYWKTRSLADLSIILMLLWMCLPEIWTKPITLGELPVQFLLSQLLLLALIAESALAPCKTSRMASLWFGAAVWMTIFGVLVTERNNWELKFYVADMWSVQSLLLGWTWARRRAYWQIVRLVSNLGMILVPTAILTIAGVLMGVIHPFDEYADRVYTSSLWNTSIILLFVAPIVHSLKTTPEATRPGARNSKLRLRLGVMLMMLGLLISVVTATRNLMLSGLICTLLATNIQGRSSVKSILTKVIVTLSIVALLCFGASLIEVKGYSLVHRLTSTTLVEENRWQELMWLFEQLGNDYLFGWGFGSLFYSTVRFHGRVFESAPHIGIATWILKGGLPALVVFVIGPVFLSVRKAIHSAGASPRRPGIVGVAMYLSLACMSGGWYPFEVFLYGIALSLCLHQPGQLTRESTLPASPMQRVPQAA